MPSNQAERLHTARTRKGLSQAELAALLVTKDKNGRVITDKNGVPRTKPQSTVGRMEGTNPMEPRVGLAIQVARALDTTVEALFDDGDDRPLEVQLEILTRHLHEITRQIQKKKAA